MKCKYCQSELPEDATVCPVCGKEQQTAEEPAALTEEIPVMEEVPAEPQAAPTAPEHAEIKEGIKATPGKIALAVAAGVVVLGVLVALVFSGIRRRDDGVQGTEAPGEPTGTAAVSTEGPDETVPATEGTIPPDGNPEDVTCKGSYTVSDDVLSGAADTVVATMDAETLTVGELQIYYWTEVYDFANSYGAYAAYFGLDFTQPLDKQSCDLGETPMTWQQFFLQSAIDTWHSYQSMALESAANGTEMDGEYQGYLDTLAEDLEQMAVNQGYADAAALLKTNFGPAATLEQYARYMEIYYNGYTHFNGLYDTFIPTQEQIEAYFTGHESEYAENGVTKESGKSHNVRHILVTVDSGSDEETGATGPSDEAWEACRAEAQQILDGWLAGEASEESFAALAEEKSEDPGSSANGGLYTELTAETNFVQSFKDWYLDESRKPGDTGLVQSEHGYHVMYYSGSEDIWYATAKADWISDKASAVVPAAMEKHPIEVDYSAIALGFIDLNA